MPKELEGYAPTPDKPISIGWRLQQMIAASEFDCRPHIWDMTPVASRAEMMAVTEIKGLMSSYRYESD